MSPPESILRWRVIASVTGLAAVAASRLGHKDAGHLLVTVYAETRRESLRAELQAIAVEGGIDARLASRRLL